MCFSAVESLCNQITGTNSNIMSFLYMCILAAVIWNGMIILIKSYNLLLFLLYCIKSLVDGSLFFTQGMINLSNGTFKTEMGTLLADKTVDAVKL
jgi:hypothetical protein